jgi:transcriptional regulator with XRE-family HTH domain
MPRKPRFIHPVRQVRTCLGLSQPAFAKLIGCSPGAVERIENGTLKLSQKLAISILEATGADPISLLAGPDAKAVDVRGSEYTKEAYALYKTILPCDEREMRFLLLKIFNQLQLLFVASHRGGKFKTYVLNSALQTALVNLADDFGLEKSIHKLLIDNGHVDKRIYRVSDLRKFSEYARILGYEDDDQFAPDDLKHFVLPRGWLVPYFLIEKPILPHGADMKLRIAKYVLDNERYIPPEIEEAIAQALYWEITEFRANLAVEPAR